MLMIRNCPPRCLIMNPTAAQLKLQDIGEQGLLQRLQRFCVGVGDDGAVLAVRPDRRLVVTTDVLVDGVHFSLGFANPIVTTPPHAAGWRSAAANLSDLAAMGALPIGVTIGLSLPPEIPVHWIEEIYQGITDCLEPWNVNIVGGDIVRSQQVSLAITALGEVPPQSILQRNGAKPGDRIVMTGIHGRSRVGLELLLGREINLSNPDDWITAHQYPRPRLDLVSHFQGVASAGMDSSDGLADAVLQICRSSQVGAILDQSEILSSPAIQELIQVVGLEQALEWVLYGGEDFELILCMPEASAIEFCKAMDSYMIGGITAEPEVWLTSPDDRRQLSIDQGFQHFP
jgi:thiamine-monophosphate kinase